jgi:hypothetical protein
MKKGLSVFAFLAMAIFTGCTHQPPIVKCGPDSFKKNSKCVKYSIKKIGTITSTSCVEKNSKTLLCSMQRLNISLENGMDILADQPVENNKLYKSGDIIEIIVKD